MILLRLMLFGHDHILRCSGFSRGVLRHATTAGKQHTKEGQAKAKEARQLDNNVVGGY